MNMVLGEYAGGQGFPLPNPGIAISGVLSATPACWQVGLRAEGFPARYR